LPLRYRSFSFFIQLSIFFSLFCPLS
jgi:hypothetical protein